MATEMSKTPKISVIMPVFNTAKWLKAAVKSILKQDFKDFELIIINDGSTDDSSKILNRLAKKDDRIILIERENRGIVASLNEGLDIAKGEYIARMDSDDISHKKRFSTQLKFMSQNDLDLCGTFMLNYDENGDLIRLSSYPKSHDSCFMMLANHTAFSHPTVMMRRQFLASNNLRYGEGKYKDAEDYALWTQMANAGAKMGNVSGALLDYRLHPNQLCATNSDRLKSDAANISAEFLARNRAALERLLEARIAENIEPNEAELSSIIHLAAKLWLKRGNIFKMQKLKKYPKKALVGECLSEIKSWL